MGRIALAGIDAGGTKTAGLLVDLEGNVLARSLAGTGNYQGPGTEVAGAEIRRALEPLFEAAVREGATVAAVGFGISGWDRPRDEEVIRAMVAAACPDVPTSIANDTYLILRAGTADGVGVAVVSGTGGNTVGCGADGRLYRVGGLLSELGDTGGGSDLGLMALKAARRGFDGRGRPTQLTERILAYWGLAHIEDAADRFIPEFGFGGGTAELAPLVLDAAAEGDRVARDLIELCGDELGLCARLVAEHLFRPDDPFPLVMGGSVLQKGRGTLFRDAIVGEVTKVFRAVTPSILQGPPVLGAVFYAADLAKERGSLPWGFAWPSADWQERVRRAEAA